MEKLKLIFSKVLEFFKKSKVKELKQTNFEKSNDEIMTSLPYVVNIENTTDKIIENVSLFFGNNQNELSFDKKGNYVANGLIISSGIPNVTYKHITSH